MLTLTRAKMKHRPVTDHVVAIESLPTLHEDPFDRVLVAQASVEGVLEDFVLDAVPLIWVVVRAYPREGFSTLR